MNWFSSRWPHWPRWAAVFTLALDSAVQVGDTGRQAIFLNKIAWTYIMLGQDAQQALVYTGRAVAVARAAGDALQEAWAWQETARARQILGDLHGAMDAVRAAAERFEQAGDVDAFCQTLLGRGDVALQLGEVAEALASFHCALELVEDPASGMTPWIAEATLPQVLGQTARALGRAGRGAEGVPLALRAMDLSGRMQMFNSQAVWLRTLGEDLYGDDHAAEARESLLRAADIFESVGRHDEASRCREKAAAKGSSGGSS
jgi:tetratricopeptide (TPR) repeat protein